MSATNAQGLIQASLREATQREFSYNGDWHALFDLEGFAPGSFNGRLMDYLAAKTGNTGSLDERWNALIISIGGAPGDGLGSFPPLVYDYDFTAISSLPSGLTYSRDSQAWGYDFQVYASNVPRLTATGLLYEDARTNLITDSQNIDADTTDWLAFNTVAMTQNAAAAPDGTNTAERYGCVDTGGTASVTVRQDVTLTANDNHTASIYAKADQTNWTAIQWRDYDETATAYFDLENGIVGATSNVESASIESIGNGWYRVSAVYQSTTDLAGNARFYLADGNSDLNIDLDGSTSILVWQAQVEIGSEPGSPIVTGAASVTRATGLLNIDLANGTYDVLIERADLNGVATKAFVDVTTAGGAGWDVPIDMTKPYLRNVRVWPDGYLSAGQKAALVA